MFRHLATALFRLRLRQLVYLAHGLGWGYRFLLIMFLSLFSYWAVQAIVTPQDSLAAIGLFLLIVLGIHFSRPDHRFLRLLAPRPYWLLTLEYLALSLPLALLLLFAEKAAWAALPILLALMVGRLPVPKKQSVKMAFLGRLVPAHFYEWRCWLHHNGHTFLFFYLLALLLLPFPVVSLLLFWVLMISGIRVYEIHEPWPLLCLPELPAKPFLKMKIRQSATVWLVIASPVLLLYTVFHPQQWWAALLFWCLLLVATGTFVLAKYASYRPNRRTTDTTLLTLVALSIPLPFLLPVPLFYAARAYRKAIKNLNDYLDAYN